MPDNHSSSTTPSWRTTIRSYYYLTKPGIIYGNIISALAGFLFASQGMVNWTLGLAALGGTALVIGGGCVLNNYIDRSIDSKMSRTKQRALVQGTITGNQAILYAGILCLAGFGVLAAFTNILTVYVGLAGLYCYVVAYGFAKRRGAIGTIVGSFSGSMPILAGYTAVTGQLDMAALLIFLAMAFWQMPHFYAIAMFRFKDYKNAGIPVLPVVKGNYYTKISIMLWIVSYTVVVALLTIFNYTTVYFFVAMLFVNLLWFGRGLQQFNVQRSLSKEAQDKVDIAWARKMFGASLITLLSFSVLLGIDSFL